MKVKISSPHITVRKIRFNVRNYILFSIFSAPFIDLVNGYFAGILPVGQVVRTIIILINIYLCAKCIPNKEKNATYIVFGIMCYVILHSIIVGLISVNGFFMNEISYGLKLMLFLTEMQLLINYSKKGIVRKEDYIHFWEFSCWFVPLSLLLCKILKLSYVTNNSKAGLYSSVNAMSIVFVIQFVMSIYFVKKKKKYWGAVLLNVVSIALLGTKSPYFYIALITIILVLHNPKNIMRNIIVFTVTVGVAYYILSKYFASAMLENIQYHAWHIMNNLKTNTMWDYVFSGRNNMLKTEWKDFSSGGFIVLKLFFGIGRVNFASGVEMDFFEILFSFGFFVTAGVYYLVFRVFSWKCREKKENIYLNLALFCMISFSTLGGHTFLEGIAATYSAILIGYKYSCYLGEKEICKQR